MDVNVVGLSVGISFFVFGLFYTYIVITQVLFGPEPNPYIFLRTCSFAIVGLGVGVLLLLLNSAAITFS